MGYLHVIPNMEELDKIEQLKAKYNLRYEFNDFYSPSVLDDRELQRKIIAFYKNSGAVSPEDTIHGAFLDVTVHSSDALIRQVSEKRVYQSMDIARELGVKGVVFHTGRLANFRPPYYISQWKKLNTDFFTKVAGEYSDLQIYMENMFDEAPDLLAELAESMKDVKNFSVCFDYAHGIITGRTPEEWTKVLAPYVRHMHINDNDKIGDLHLPLGQGSIDWAEYSALMKQHGIDCSTLIEVKGYDAMKASLEYMEQNHIYPFV